MYVVALSLFAFLLPAEDELLNDLFIAPSLSVAGLEFSPDHIKLSLQFHGDLNCSRCHTESL